MDSEEARVLGCEHGTVLHRFEPTDEIQNGGMVDYYAAGFNQGLATAARYVLAVIGENRALKTTASEKAAGAVAIETPDPEQLKVEELLDRKGQYNIDRINPLRSSWKLPPTTQADVLKRTLERSRREDEGAAKLMPKALGS